jgi:hypothetical protein
MTTTCCVVLTQVALSQVVLTQVAMSQVFGSGDGAADPAARFVRHSIPADPTAQPGPVARCRALIAAGTTDDDRSDALPVGVTNDVVSVRRDPVGLTTTRPRGPFHASRAN